MSNFIRNKVYDKNMCFISSFSKYILSNTVFFDQIIIVVEMLVSRIIKHRNISRLHLLTLKSTLGGEKNVICDNVFRRAQKFANMARPQNSPNVKIQEQDKRAVRSTMCICDGINLPLKHR